MAANANDAQALGPPRPHPHPHPPPNPNAGPPPSPPPLAGDALLLVRVHHSVHNPPLYEPYGNYRRLAALGRRSLDAAYTAAVGLARRDLNGVALQNYVDATFDAFVDRWVTAYGWRQQMYGVPLGTDLDAPTETRQIFETFAGAVVAQQNLGLPVLMAWIQQLV